MNDPTQTTVLVTGASGAIGGLLVNELAARGGKVRAVMRSGDNGELPDGVEVISGDLRDDDVARAAVKDADVVFHFAAKLHVNAPAGSMLREYEEVNVGVTRSLLELSNCERFIFASSINVYGTGGPFDETSPVHPEGPYAETKLAAEKLVLGHQGGTVLRYGAVYGKRMKGNFPRLVEALRKRRFAYVGSGKNRRTLVHESDAVRAAILTSEKELAKGKIYNVTDGGVHTLEEIVTAISNAIGRKPPSLHLPESLARASCSVADLLLRTAHSNHRLTPLIDKINEDIAVSGKRIHDELGFEPEFGLEDGWREAIDSL